MPKHDDILRAALDNTGITYKYRVYRGKEAVPPPYIAYYFTVVRHRVSDNGLAAVDEADAVVELYTAGKDFEREALLDAALGGYDYTKTEEYSEAEELYRVSYELTITTKHRRA
jgi:hypothetical protein